MTLPRFTSGQVGRLDFAALNEAFGYIDEARGLSPPSASSPKDSGVLFARIGQTGEQLGVTVPPSRALQFVGHYWNEVVSTAGSWEALEGGRSSGSLTTGTPADAVRFPALSITGKTLDENVVAVLFPQMTRATSQFPSSLFYAAVQIPEGPQPMRIDGSTPISGSVGRWTYSVTKTAWNGFTKTFNAVSPAVSGSAYNSLELLADGTPANSFGVGSIKPATASVTRQPIKTGAVVMCSQLGGSWHFSVPNGYGINCG
jgi:hypothetical protein